MTTAISRLLDIAGPPLSVQDNWHSLRATSHSPRLDDLVSLLSCRNGFYAFESALHVLGTMDGGGEFGLLSWNADTLWKSSYQGMADKRFFFAEDAFGGQYFIADGGVFSFDPETAKDEIVGNSVEEWTRAVLDDFEVLTGYQLAHQWQEENGALKPGCRLVPKVPFTLGGEYATHNLRSMESAKAMRLRAGLAVQLRDLPDGSQIRWQVTD